MFLLEDTFCRNKLVVLIEFWSVVSCILTLSRPSLLYPISLEFENGTVGEGFFSLASRHRPVPVTTRPLELFVLYGEQGMIHNIQGWHLYSTKDKACSDGPTRLDIPSRDFSECFDNEIRHFLECIETGAEPISSGRDNLGTLAVIEAVYQSAKTGQVVGVPSHILEEQ